MPDWLAVVILGIIEGVTEFLPVSSTGHLLIAERWLLKQTDLFTVGIQSGAVIAVVVIFTQRLYQLVVHWRSKESQDYLLKLGLAFGITAAGGLLLKKLGFELPDTVVPVALATLVGGVLFLGVERWLRGRVLSDVISWRVAAMLAVGQLLAAVFPGASRSGTTILMGMVLGVSRPAATEFSFLLGIPTLLSAGALQLFSTLRDPEAPPVAWGLLLLGTLVSAATAFASVKWLLRYVQTHTFEIFGWYRIFLGGILLWWLS